MRRKVEAVIGLIAGLALGASVGFAAIGVTSALIIWFC